MSWRPWRHREESHNCSNSQRRGANQVRTCSFFFKELDLVVTVMLLENTPAVLSLGKLCEDHGHTNHWTSGRKPQLAKKARELIAKHQTLYHSLSLVYRRILPRHLHLLLQHHHRRTLYLTWADTRKIPQLKKVEVRAGSYGETRCTDLQKPETQIKMEETIKSELQEFRKHKVDERSPSEPRGNPALGHRVRLMNNQLSREQKCTGE